jgi:RNA polymerase sigma-70 factor (ECF subfamily)
VIDDLDLLRAYRDGDTAGFERLFLRHRTRLRALCLRHLRDDAAADDTVQETFLRLLRVADRFEDGFNVSAWLRRVATNVCMDELRRRRRLRVVEEGEPMLFGIPDATRALQPEAAHEMAEARAAVTQIARAVPGRGGAALLLREVAGLSYVAIAGQLGISVGAVETLLFRARRRFAEEYLRLEGVAPTQCGMIRHVLEVIGRSHLGVYERRLVARHLRECSTCRHRSDDLASPVLHVDGSGEARVARSASRYGGRSRVGAAG